MSDTGRRNSWTCRTLAQDRERVRGDVRDVLTVQPGFRTDGFREQVTRLTGRRVEVVRTSDAPLLDPEAVAWALAEAHDAGLDGSPEPSRLIRKQRRADRHRGVSGCERLDELGRGGNVRIHEYRLPRPSDAAPIEVRRHPLPPSWLAARLPPGAERFGCPSIGGAHEDDPGRLLDLAIGARVRVGESASEHLLERSPRIAHRPVLAEEVAKQQRVACAGGAVCAHVDVARAAASRRSEDQLRDVAGSRRLDVVPHLGSASEADTLEQALHRAVIECWHADLDVDDVFATSPGTEVDPMCSMTPL